MTSPNPNWPVTSLKMGFGTPPGGQWPLNINAQFTPAGPWNTTGIVPWAANFGTITGVTLLEQAGASSSAALLTPAGGNAISYLSSEWVPILQGTAIAGTPFTAFAQVASQISSNVFSFETGTQGWAGSHATVATSTAYAFSGTQSLAITSDGTGAVSWGAAMPQQPVNPGDTITCSAFVFTPQPLAQARITIDWYDATHAPLSSNSGTAQATAAGQVAEVTASFTAPASTAFFDVAVQDAADFTLGTVMYADAVTWVRSIGYANCFVNIDWADSNQNYLSTASGPAVSAPATGALVNLLESSTAPAGAAYARVSVGESGTPAATATLYVDTAYIVVGATAAGTQPANVITGYTDLTTRFSGLSVTRGIQYQLGRAQAFESTLKLRNDDGALDPVNTASPYYPLVRIFTPVAVQALWNGATYTVAGASMERWPQTWADPHWGEISAQTIDSYANLAQTLLQSAMKEDVLLDQPYAYFPCGDPQGQAYATNAAKSGNTLPLNILTSRYGDGGTADNPVTAAFGASPQNAQNQAVSLAGDAGSVFAIAGVPSQGATNAKQGVCLSYGYDGGLPDIATTGITIEFWIIAPQSVSTDATKGIQLFLLLSAEPTPDVTNTDGTPVVTGPGIGGTFIASGSLTTAKQVQLTLHTFDGVNILRSDGPVLTSSSLVADPNTLANSQWTHVVFTASGLGVQLYINGQLDVATSVIGWLKTKGSYVQFLGDQTPWFAGNFGNVNGFAHAAVYNGVLSASRIASHYASGTTAFAGETEGSRFTRLLKYAGWTGGAVVAAGDSLAGPLSTIDGQSVGDALGDVGDSEFGLFYIAGPGQPVFRNRRASNNRLPRWTVGTQPGEFPFKLDVEYDFDPMYLQNQIQVTRTGGAVANAVNNQSVQLYLPRQLQRTIFSNDDRDATDQANWIAVNVGNSGIRVQKMTFNPAADPDLWAFALNADVGDKISVDHQPPGSAPVQFTAEIQSIQHEVEAGKWDMSIMALYTYQTVLQPGDATFGVLGSNALGY